MLRVNKGDSNDLWVNASRNKTLSNPTYLFAMEHKVSGDKLYFIPQNITNQAAYYGTPDNDPRVDVLRFFESEASNNLTGGTRAFYYQLSPSLLNRSLGTANNTDSEWIFQNWRNSTTGEFGVYVDSTNSGETIIPTGKWWVDGVLIDSSYYEYRVFDNDNISFSIRIEDASLYDGQIFQYQFQTSLGRLFQGTLYLASLNELTAYEPWTYYNLPEPDSLPGGLGVDTIYPTTYLGQTRIYIENSGWYYYRIYEQTSKTNLAPSFSKFIVDEGTLYVEPSPPTEQTYEGYSNEEIIVYGEGTPTNHILQESAYHILTENNELLTQE